MTDPRDENHKTYFLLHQQDEVRVEIEDGDLVLVQTDSYGEEAKIFVGCAYIDHFTDILTFALKDYWSQRAQRNTANAPPTHPSDASEPPPKRSSDPTAAERMRRYRARKAEVVTEDVTVTEAETCTVTARDA
ncbi:hypothetical protein AC629_36405 [Bradyrhizobium sp. NAS80.1]|uniref:hypothetical protein n=1 Tax=Bradyrhizobium sp. NAS80.1 TaxID=1680159 RepID=UPI00095F8B85|nr:hypothetical protein [Bradyrhizobium sp. NAS80.1]OKO73748.1 hypothetical protein AC629_36405 [Bradyrhizobium sp. NAS80.1]